MNRGLSLVKLLGLVELYYLRGAKVNAKSSNRDLDPTVLDPHFIAFDRAFLFGKTFAGADVEPPAVEVAFDDIAVKPRIGERIAFVRAEVFDGVE